MKRPDLDGDYDGWQVLDPTPQETSAGQSMLMHLENSNAVYPCMRIRPIASKHAVIPTGI